MSSNQLTFVVFILNKYALATKQPITEVYKRFDELHILDNYLFWEIGRYINQNILEDERADYGKKILSTLSAKLMIQDVQKHKNHKIQHHENR